MSKAPETLAISETNALLSELQHSFCSRFRVWKNMRNYTMALLMLDAGLRVGEVCRLKISNLLFNNQAVESLTLSSELAEKSCTRSIPLSDRLKLAIDNCNKLIWYGLASTTNMPAFFDTDMPKGITPRQVQNIIGNAGMKSIGRKVRPHMLRHTFATRLMRVTSTPTVQHLLGHKHLSSTQVYVHPNADDCKTAINKIETAS